MTLQLPVDGTSTVGHLLASVGVPKTEVGGLLMDGRPIDRGYLPRPGDRISILTVERPQSAPTSPPRFVLDVHLGARPAACACSGWTPPTTSTPTTGR
jgi:uncharacterized protein